MVFKRVLRGLYSPKNVLLVVDESSGLTKHIESAKWLNYRLKHQSKSIKEEDIKLYINQYNIDTIIYDFQLSIWDLERVKSLLEDKHVQFLIINPENKSGLILKKVISDYRLFSLAK